ncbi:peptidylprolyl isomerase [Celeribacter persicus]|uniref:Peptidyl-prolyl cis-trans isomerase n=1 Tax=Celeribacter persicus TaxID=1651082 RepID=A0A2T5HAG8_9RHOB|nr:peptidylprolyl isomerase [Celeribacter persicus]PTQ68569.1 peptidylprolyl isomerase [Celeribacter persicus]
MLKSLTLIAALATGPAFATGLDIVVEGEANGLVHIDLFEDVAPGHVDQITKLANEGAYDNVVFHRVIDGFMAQTGDVQYGKMGTADFSMQMAGRGGSHYPDLKAEFSDLSFDEGVVGMARSQNPNSANAQFFIMFAPAPHLNGQYTVVGKVTSGMDVVHAIKKGNGPNGAVIGQPDVMTSVKVTE